MPRGSCILRWYLFTEKLTGSRVIFVWISRNLFAREWKTGQFSCQQVNMRLQKQETTYLKSSNSCALETEIGLEILSDFPHQPLEWQLSYEQFGRLLVPPDLTKSDGSRPVPVRLLHSTSWRGTLTSGLCGELLTRSLSSCRFTGSLLCTSHDSTGE